MSGPEDIKEDLVSQQRTKAAEVIQKAWRRHIDIQVFRYYRDLITFKCQGDPSHMLKCINPIEAQLLDAASGAFIRFRLAGEKFPPNIYYKVFTRSPVVDMCANSPKNYAKKSSLKLAAREQNNKTGDEHRTHPSEVPTDWYKRFENNGWRLISDRNIQQGDSDITTYSTSRKLYKQHHDGLLKIEDVKRRRKEKKINWLRKMYEQKLLKCTDENDQMRTDRVMELTEQMIDCVKESSVAAGVNRSPYFSSYSPVDQFDEWEVDELLGWTNALNFDDYLDDWKTMACTSSGEENRQREVDIRRKSAYLTDACEFTVQRETKLQSAQPDPLAHQFNTSARAFAYNPHN